MKKHMMNSSRRKWIVGGGLFFGGIALLTTGFATWIVGTQIMNSNQNHGVTIDTALNESISIAVEMSSDSTIHLAEKITQDTNNENQVVFTTGDEEPDMKWVYSKITIQCGKSYYEKNYATYNDLTKKYEPKDFELGIKLNYSNTLSEEEKLTLSDITANNLVKDENIFLENVSRKTLGNDEKYTYVDLESNTIKVNAGSEENSPATVQWVDKSGYRELVLTDVTVNLVWGTFFHLSSIENGEPVTTAYSPANFYNELAKDDAFLTVGNVSNIYNEMNAMVNAFTAEEGKSAVLSVMISLPESL